MSFLRLARVAAVHPEDHSVDIVLVDDGSRFAGVQVLAQSATTNSGSYDLPNVGATADKYSLTQSTDRDMLAVVGFLAASTPIVFGFLFPQVNGVLFSDPDRRVTRHASDVYSTTDGQGNTEFYHPSGTFVRIGTSPDHEDLTGKDFDGNWAIRKNTGKAVYLRVRLANAGAEKAVLTIDPSGNLSATLAGQATVNVTGTTTINSGGKATVVAPEVLVDSPKATFTGQVIVQGLLTYQAGMAGSGGSGTTASITGNVSVTGNISNTGSLTNNGKDVGSGHRHANSGGSGTGGVPI